MTSVTSFDPTIIRHMREALRLGGDAQGQDAIALAGNTGAGKSVTTCYLLQQNMQLNNGKVDVAPPQVAIAPIGHTASKTEYAKMYAVGTRCVIDTGGFLDTRGEVASVVVPFSTKTTLQRAKSVRLGLCADVNLMNVDRGVHLTDLFLTTLSRLVNNQFEQISESFLVIFTKVRKMTVIKDGEECEIAPTIEHIKSALYFIRNSLPPDSLQQKVYDFILRNDGKYITLVKPLDSGESRNEILAKFDEMRPIADPKACFSAIPFSHATRLWVLTTMQSIAGDGKEQYEIYGNAIRCIEECDDALQTLAGRVETFQARIEELGNADPQVVLNGRARIISEAREQIGSERAAMAALAGRIDEIRSSKGRIDGMIAAAEGDQSLASYNRWTIDQEAVVIPAQQIEVDAGTDIDYNAVLVGAVQGGITGAEGGPVGVAVGALTGAAGALLGSKKEKKKIVTIPERKFPVTGQFNYQGPEIAELRMNPAADSGRWNTRQGGVGEKVCVIDYTSEPGQRGVASIDAMVKSRDLPSKIVELTQLKGEATNMGVMIDHLQADISRHEATISSLERIIENAERESVQASELNADIDALKRDRDNLQEEKEKFEAARDEAIATLRGKRDDLHLVDEYAEVSGDHELKESRVFKSYETLRERYASVILI